jgi:hypothetical protein
MAESTIFSKEKSRETGRHLPSHQPKDRRGPDVSVSAILGGERGSTVPSACADTGSGVRESDPTIHYTPRPNATSEAEIETLAHIYDFAIRAYEKWNAAETEDGHVGEEEAGQGHTQGHAPEKGKL